MSRWEAGSDGQQAAKAPCATTGSALLQLFYLSSIKLIEQMRQTKNPHTLFLVSPLLGFPVRTQFVTIQITSLLWHLPHQQNSQHWLKHRSFNYPQYFLYKHTSLLHSFCELELFSFFCLRKKNKPSFVQTKAVLLTKPEPLFKLSNLPCKKCCLWVTPYDRLSPDSATSWSLAKGAEESMYTQGLIAWGFYDTPRIRSLSFKIVNFFRAYQG